MTSTKLRLVAALILFAVFATAVVAVSPRPQIAVQEIRLPNVSRPEFTPPAPPDPSECLNAFTTIALMFPHGGGIVYIPKSSMPLFLRNLHTLGEDFWGNTTVGNLVDTLRACTGYTVIDGGDYWNLTQTP